jgi:hypothetical protein
MGRARLIRLSAVSEGCHRRCLLAILKAGSRLSLLTISELRRMSINRLPSRGSPRPGGTPGPEDRAALWRFRGERSCRARAPCPVDAIVCRASVLAVGAVGSTAPGSGRPAARSRDRRGPPPVNAHSRCPGGRPWAWAARLPPVGHRRCNHPVTNGDQPLTRQLRTVTLAKRDNRRRP